METKVFRQFLKGYIQAAGLSLCSFFILSVISLGFLNWYFFEYIFVVFIATVLHFLFLLGLFLMLFPLITYADGRSEEATFRGLFDRYMPLFAIPFGIIIGLTLLLIPDDKFLIFVLFDMLSTCYIGLYYYVKNIGK